MTTGPFVVAFFGFGISQKKHLNRCFFGFWILEAKNKDHIFFYFQKAEKSHNKRALHPFGTSVWQSLDSIR
jgi:hypothetical protein